jgi:hypothetical protein
MADIKERIAAELENIDKIIAELDKCDELSKLSTIELAGVGALLHNFYNSIENAIKQIFIDENKALPSGTFWHKDLLETATTEEVLSHATKEMLGPFLAFRHFFVHGYSLDLRADLLHTLVDTLPSVYKEFKDDLKRQKLL